MSRKPSDRAAQNQQTIKSLLKLEANKNCADCKRNKHPRWASWNLGIFVCIRCSGIHRGMGTHISRVKSVDLDAWTDEQLQSVLSWGNGRANKYWEAKLAPGHVPSEAKIENFIRTKYESKRWVMEGPMPDPSTLDADGDDDVPLNIVQEKAKLDRSSSQRIPSASSQPPAPAPVRKPQPAFDLIGGDDTPSPPVRPSTTDTPGTAARPAPPKSQAPSQLLSGLDFLGAPPERPASASSKPAGMSRPDLKQSILSLYASTPKPQTQSAAPPSSQHGKQPSFGGMQGPTQSSASAFGDLNDAFGGLNFGSTSSAPPSTQLQQKQQPKTSAFPSFGQSIPPPKAPAAAPLVSNPPPLSGGNFFDSGPKPPPKPSVTKTTTAPPPLSVRKVSNASDGFGEFSSALNPMTASSIATSANGLLDLSSPPPPAISSARPANPKAPTNSIFNLSAPKAPTNYNQVTQSSAPASKTTFTNLASDPWGANEWTTNEPAMATPQTGISVTSPSKVSVTGADFGWGNSPLPTTSAPTNNDWGKSPTAPVPNTLNAQPDWGSSPGFSSNAASTLSGGWGSASPSGADSGFGGFGSAAPAPPKIAAEEDFGDWGSAPSDPAPAPAPALAAAPMPAAPLRQEPAPKANTGDDLWSNVWQ